MVCSSLSYKFVRNSLFLNIRPPIEVFILQLRAWLPPFMNDLFLGQRDIQRSFSNSYIGTRWKHVLWLPYAIQVAKSYQKYMSYITLNTYHFYDGNMINQCYLVNMLLFMINASLYLVNSTYDYTL